MLHFISNKQRVFGLAVLGLLALLAALFFLSFLIGSYPLDAKTVWDILTASLRDLEPYWESAAWKVVETTEDLTEKIAYFYSHFFKRELTEDQIVAIIGP